MNGIRSKLDWNKINKSDLFNGTVLDDFKYNLEYYIRHCFFLSNKFTFGGKNGVKNFNSNWKMPWTKKKIKSKNMLFEICNLLFNYGILNFNQAMVYIKGSHNEK